ncbi:MAG: 30S ribosomal protein S12 methylthiotransferase RimO [Lentisphaeria bacterium]|nr:30S ribosomal protein S12 methylthiotransferase RimO [Lentisphaeria bacterium]
MAPRARANPSRRREPASARPPCVLVVSLGCAKNLVDTEVMCGSLLAAGFGLTQDARDADVMLINTCSFIRDARLEASREIQAALRWKRRGRGRRTVAVAGCLPQRSAADTRREFPGVDIFLGLDDVPRVAELLTDLLRSGVGQAHTPAEGPPTYLYDHTAPRLTLTPASYGYVKIAEGCDHRCAYCAIPAIRGRQRSRSIHSVVEECRQLLDQGAAELDLVAQDTSRFGTDRHDGSNLAALVRAIDALPGNFWVRLLYTHPLHMTDDLLEVLAGAAHVVPYLDIPLQHISTPILKAMRRGMTGPATRRLMARIRERWPHVAVRTTFLLGFPGETDRDAGELLAFAAEYRFERLGAFVFSPEAGTPAATLTAEAVPPDVARARRDALMTRQQAIALEQNRALVGTCIRVIADAEERPGHYRGRTAADAPDIDNTIRFQGPPGGIPGHFAAVTVTQASPYDLFGQVASGLLR